MASSLAALLLGGCGAHGGVTAANQAEHARQEPAQTDPSDGVDPDCSPPTKAKRIFVGFADGRFELETFELAAMRSEAIVSRVLATACTLDREADPDHALARALSDGELELHSVVFASRSLDRAEVRLRPRRAGDPSFVLEVEVTVVEDVAIEDGGAAGATQDTLRIVRARPQPVAPTAGKALPP